MKDESKSESMTTIRRRALDLVKYLIWKGESNQAVSTLFKLFALELNHDKDFYTRASNAVLEIYKQDHRWPDLGIRFDLESEHPKITFDKKNYSTVDAWSFYVNYKTMVQAKYYYDDKSGGIEKRVRHVYYKYKHVFLTYLIAKLTKLSVASSNRYRTRCNRSLTFIVSWLSYPLLRMKSRSKYEDMEKSVSKALGTTKQESKRILRDSNAYSYLYRFDNEILFNNPSKSESLVHEFSWDGEEDYLDLYEQRGPARVLAMIHMGRTASALRRVEQRSIKGSDTIWMMAYEMSRDSKKSLIREYKKMGLNMQIATPAHQNIPAIVSRLRKGKTSLTISYDLTSNSGETIPISFFGQPARVVKGPAEIAMLGRVPIYMLFTFEDDGIQKIVVSKPLETAPKINESMEEAVIRITQELFSGAEEYIKKYPEQWKFIGILRNFYVGKDGLVA